MKKSIEGQGGVGGDLGQ